MPAFDDHHVLSSVARHLIKQEAPRPSADLHCARAAASRGADALRGTTVGVEPSYSAELLRVCVLFGKRTVQYVRAICI